MTDCAVFERKCVCVCGGGQRRCVHYPEDSSLSLAAAAAACRRRCTKSNINRIRIYSCCAAAHACCFVLKFFMFIFIKYITMYTFMYMFYYSI